MLPLPEILQKAAEIIRLASALTYNPAHQEISTLKHAAKTVTPEDVLAVLQEVAGFFHWSNNIQILDIGSAPDLQGKKFALRVVLSHPAGPRVLTVPLSLEQAQSVIKNFNETLAALAVTEGKLIMDTGSA